MKPAVEKERKGQSKPLQYVGVSMIAGAREYGFRVANQEEPDRLFTLIIEGVDFLSRKLKYQEGPDLCYRKLLGLLAVEQSDSPLHSRQQVSVSDVAEYVEAGSAKPKNRFEVRRARRPGEAFTTAFVDRVHKPPGDH
jgi:hypothetical protein